MVAALVTAAVSLAAPHGQLLYSSGTPFQLRLLDVATGHVRQLTHDRRWYVDPVWSRDGRLIAVSASGAITLLDTRGRRVRTLTDGVIVDSDPAWSPDGSRIAFLRKPANPGGYHGEQFDVMVVNVDGSGLARLTNSTSKKRALSWSNDGLRIRFVAGHIARTWLADVSLNGGEHELLPAFSGAWSPDGKRLAYVLPQLRQLSLIVADADGSNPRPVAAAPGNRELGEPAWSADSSRLLFTYRGRNMQRTWLELVRADGSALHRVTAARGHVDSSPTWSPDGAEIAFVRHPFTRPPLRSYVAIVRPDGRGLRVFRQAGWRWGDNVAPPVWRP